MKELIIKKEYINDKLSPGELMLLIMVYDQNKLLFKHFLSVYGGYTHAALKSLQNKIFIKINGEEFEDLIIRERGLKLLKPSIREENLKLFESNKLNMSITRIIEYLNSKLNKSRGFSIKSKGNRKFISARLKDGYTEEDLKSVINIKYDEWAGTSNEFYLRPETLFNDTKFGSYLMQTESSKINNNSMPTTTFI